MLIVARKEGEKIAIGNDVFVSVELIDGQQVRIGIAAPKSVIILREALLAAESRRKDKE